MKYGRWICLLFVMSVAAVAFAGDIQVSCSPDLRIYLDNQFMGTSNTMQDGLFLMNVPDGKRTLRVEKDGFVPQSIQVEVSNFPIEVRIGMLSPEPVVHYKKEPEAEPVKQLVGNLVVTSAPQNCDVEIDGRTETKNTPQLSIEGLAAGKHTISFSKPGYNRVTGEITIEPGAEVRVRGSLIEGRIDTLYEGKGSLLVKSKPNRCTIRFRGKLIEKDRPNFRMTHIPAGEYPMKISIRGRELSTNVLIRNDKRTVLEVSFVKGDKPFVVSYVTQ